ncbi:hypothetical protein AAGG74_15135 [Bacillus mexicanus]|uniref:hypothetical protein n=1 Tax=Bacillus mexicanus TaxID=2834415 RepID=UPI003D19FC11
MIEWKKYNPDIPPKLNKDYLVSDGKQVEVAYILDDTGVAKWYPPEMSNLEFIEYYAEINIPYKNQRRS